MMYSLVTTSHVQYLVTNDLHYFKTEHKASEHILSVNIPQPIPYTTTPRRCNLVISSLCRGILLCPLQCSRILRRSFYHRKAIRGRNTLLFESKNNKCDTKRKPRTQGLREAVTNSHRVFTALARSGPNSSYSQECRKTLHTLGFYSMKQKTL